MLAITQKALTAQRQLNRGNANSDALVKDFARFGIDLWPRLKDADAHTQRRQAQLEQLNRARNAIAHSDEEQVDEVYPEEQWLLVWMPLHGSSGEVLARDLINVPLSAVKDSKVA